MHLALQTLALAGQASKLTIVPSCQASALLFAADRVCSYGANTAGGATDGAATPVCHAAVHAAQSFPNGLQPLLPLPVDVLCVAPHSFEVVDDLSTDPVFYQLDWKPGVRPYKQGILQQRA